MNTVTSVNAVLAVVMVFVGCCSNVLFLELVIKVDPGAGNLVTFLQFLYIAIGGSCVRVCSVGGWERHIPIGRYAALVALFWGSSVANNLAFDMNVSMPLSLVFRSGSLLANMALGVWLLGKRYSPLKYLAVSMISAGITLCTIQSSRTIEGHHVTISPDAAEAERLRSIEWLWWCLGVGLMTFALFANAGLGIFQESLFTKYGKHPWEALYYSHLLPLVFWLPTASNLLLHTRLAMDSVPLEVFGLAVPQQLVWLLLCVFTQAVCISAVYVLTSECCSLTVTLTITLRKFLSLMFSILYFKNPFTVIHWIGTFLVFLGTVIFTELLQKIAVLLTLVRTKSVDT